MNPTIEEIDKVLTSLPPTRFLKASELPEWLDASEVRYITETVHTGALRSNDGERLRFYDADGITDALLDLRVSLSGISTKEPVAV